VFPGVNAEVVDWINRFSLSQTICNLVRLVSCASNPTLQESPDTGTVTFHTILGQGRVGLFPEAELVGFGTGFPFE